MDNKKKKISIPGWVLVLVMAVYGELILHIWTNSPIVPAKLAAVTAFGLGFGGLLALVTSLIPGKVQKWAAALISFLLAVMYLTWYFINESFKIFMTISTIRSGAEGVATGFLSTVLALLSHDWWRIVLVLLPIVVYLILARCPNARWKTRGFLAAGTLVCWLLGFCAVRFWSGDQVVFRDAYNFDSAVHDFGLNVALALDLGRSGHAEENLEFKPVETLPPVTEAPGEVQESTEATEAPAVVYEPNVMDFDFEALAEAAPNKSIAAVHRYVGSLTPTMQNEYTGLFAGKNLIFISAEAFSGEVIDQERTPALYRMANEGIVFSDYYQPNWGGGTSGGEFANLVGIPGSGSCMVEAAEQNLFLTLGHQFQRLGYRTEAFHNNDMTFYHRNHTHTFLGYDRFLAMGNGMEEGVQAVWPESDLEMFQFTIPEYLECGEPFHLYYMSVSGHSLYSYDSNAMARKNYDTVKDLDCSEEVKCYLAANQELENAMAYLLEELEKADLMDDTVVVIAADHYPYGLERSATWGNETDRLSELYGQPCTNDIIRDHNRLIIWSGCIEDMDLRVDAPTSSLDILPTISNLFGLDYDSRLLAGRDVFSDAEPIVLWNNYGWKTDKGSYNAFDREFTPAEGVTVEEGYVERICAIVKNRLTYADSVKNLNYFNYLPLPESHQPLDQ